MREADRQDKFSALHLRSIADTLQLQLFAEPGSNSRDHIGDERAGQAVHRPMAGLLAGAGDDNLTVLLLDAHFGIEVAAQLAFRALNKDLRAVNANLDSGRDGDWILSDSRHRSPHVAKDFAAYAAAAGFLTGHNPFGRREDSDAETAVDARDLALGRVDAEARPAQALDAHHDRLASGGVGVMDADGLVVALAANLEVTDVALDLEDLGKGDPGLGGGHIRVIVAGHERGPDPREHVGDGICDHALTS